MSTTDNDLIEPIDLRIGWQTTRVLIGLRAENGTERVIPMTPEFARHMAQELIQRAEQAEAYARGVDQRGR